MQKSDIPKCIYDLILIQQVIKEVVITDIDRIQVIMMIDAIVMNVLRNMVTEESIMIPMVITMTDVDDTQVTALVVTTS